MCALEPGTSRPDSEEVAVEETPSSFYENDLVRYFRRPWDEGRGDEYASWGTSTFYLAVDDTGTAHQQVEVYANGVVLAYDEQHAEDRYGGLTYADLDLEEFSPFEITRQEFFDALAEIEPINRHHLGDDGMCPRNRSGAPSPV
ncbi:hypothetical protein ACWDLG_10520 [Nonomuraea sp. NPDC003727]